MGAINVNSTVFARLSETQLCQTKTLLKFEGRLLSIGKKKKKSSIVSDGWCSCNDKKNQVHQNRTRLNAVSSESYSIRSVSLYEVLGIEEDVGVDDIKQAYRQLVRKYHPDVCSQDDAEECKSRFIEIQEAYETLSDPNTRTIYDSRRAQGLGFSKFHYPSEEIAKEEWRSIWEVQLSMLKQKSRSEATEKPLSWGARMRQMKRSAQNN